MKRMLHHAWRLPGRTMPTRRCLPAPTAASLALCLGLSLFSCQKDSYSSNNQLPYDPGRPVVFNNFFVDSGVIRTKVIIKGTNFGNDKSLVKVYFIDNEKSRPATVVNIDNENIYCLVPKQNGGNNKISIKVKNDSVSIAKTFRYSVSQNISNVVGLTGVAGSVDGSMADGRIQRTFGIAALGEDQVMSFEMLSGAVRYLSIPENKIYTVQTGFAAGQPAINAARTKVYAIQYGVPHKVICYKKENLWAPEVLTAGIARPNGVTVAGVIVSAALDNTEQWLYFRDKAGVFGRLEIDNPGNVQILNETCGPVGSADYNYLAYSRVDDCFYFGVQNIHSIYRVEKNGTNVQLWAGSSQGTNDGPRLEAKFNSPGGLAVDGEGNILIMDTNNHTVRRLNHGSGYVSRIAGTTASLGFSNGDPLSSKLNYPYAINADEYDNYFLGESWGCTIRKLAIE
ncbi:IPT/TIG domain-containing protein [Filimonas effusa]|uniref:IPT/TIG domain-containing protein n=1 Tax=Filimonas effusa TaxID=2508721 RepID=A0A4Q1DC68_9BACT|nr:IPT/TIG domain-containing protein [Filimonas effusa]RXK87104.1 hypothetical protein ESB13_10050 [Filimonas effusa]